MAPQIWQPDPACFLSGRHHTCIYVSALGSQAWDVKEDAQEVCTIASKQFMLELHTWNKLWRCVFCD